MPVTRREPPSDAAQAVNAALAHFAGVPEARLHALQGTKPAELTPTAPHEVFSLGLSDLVGPDPLAATRATGWRYLLAQDNQIVASAETVGGQAGGQRFSHFNSGPFVASTAAALDTVDGLAATDPASFELRLLHVQALHTMALWLHGDGADDLLVPLAPAPAGVEPNRAYPAADLLAILAGQAGAAAAIGPDDTRGS
jgi:hypothetical protein